MNNVRLLVSALVVTGLVISIFIFNYVIPYSDEIVSDKSDGAALTLKKEGSNIAVLPQQEEATAENNIDTPYSGPMVQYVGAVEKYDNSLLGENARIYKTYDDNTLVALAEGGDLLAIKVLADRSFREHQGIIPDDKLEEEMKRLNDYRQKKKKYVELSLVYGDMELVDSAAILSVSAYDRRDQTQLRSAALEELAFLEFKAMRGMQTAKYLKAPWVIKRYSKQFATPLVLSQEEKAHIRERAQAIYDDLEAKRKALNLGVFEDVEESYYEPPGYNPTRDYMDAMGENAF